MAIIKTIANVHVIPVVAVALEIVAILKNTKEEETFLYMNCFKKIL
ncbi:hypothetical protein DOY81_012981 [Sarcophaga bullata]|nr:hypothetical protein DOY81_012981 [Sarcophaga bullata]